MTIMDRPLLVGVLCFAVAPTASAQRPMDLSPTEMLKRADTDGDGTLSRDEFIKARTARLEEAFGRMDANGDDRLDAAEAEAAAEQMRSVVADGREGFRRPGGPRPQRPDGEGRGGGAFGEQAFDRLDGDGDGTLSRAEFAEGMARMRESMQRGGPGPGGPGRPDRGGRGPAEGFRRPPQQD